MTKNQGRAGDLAKGMKAISEHLGITIRQGFHMHEQGLIPTFHIGRSVCAKRSALDDWLNHAARKAVEGGADE
ncbi:MAG: DNA-binding protein [Aquamicrobium sp.]|uniref:DNA-binding protein n=1 Tax=Aquamicrobium sp. TaxID=1872579 RepID=UPI00349E731F|nr:DNA-binding protein [Aquamicrobium sp.]